ncbi:MAG: InlB B-repeat-containing protein, partial [Lachnospiraceae bacterium]|nr:InlB B-repeat-containing protein [Lachnospiraceae bacterium]
DGSVTTPFIVYENAEGDIAGYSTGEVDLLEKIDEKLGIFPVKNTYKILFDGNGAKSGSMEDMVCTRKVLYTLNANAFQRTGYQFSAWNTKSDGSGTSYKDKAKVLDIVGSDTSENEIRLYAIWKANEYTISFLGNGATSGSMSAQKGCKYDQSIALKANAFKRKGYAFTGWNTKSNGKGTTYKNKATVKNLSAKAGAQVSLYAQWQKQKYTITYKLSNGKNNKGNPAYYEITSATITLKNPSRKGYAFKGWYTDSKFKKKATGIKKGSTGNKTFYAKWAANTYYVVFHGNGSNSGKMSKKYTCKYDATLTLPKNVFKKTGYSFQGWNTKKNGKGTACKNKAKVKNLSAKSGSTVTLYAQWKAISYKISFKANGGTGTMSDLSCTYGKTYKIPACTFVKNKYSFTKWNTKANGKGTSYAKGASIKNLTTKNGQTITLYARWELHFDKISLGAKSRSKNEIKKFIASHPVSTNDTYSKNPSVSGTIAAGKLSSNTLKSALNAVNVYRYIAGLNADITLDENYSDYASKATLVNYLNDDMSHTPLRPGVLSSSAYDSLYEDAYYGASHSNLAWASWNMPLKNAVDLWMDDTDAYNIDRVGHRRWLLFSRLAKIGFGKTGGHTAVFVIGESRSSSPASWTWPARNTPVGYFDDETAWSLTMGEYVDSSKVQVAVKRDSDGKTWKFSSKSSNGYFGVDNGGYGDVGCIVFQPTSISCSAGQTYTVTVHFYDSMEVLEYKVNFY